jgi:hypothetical protein
MRRSFMCKVLFFGSIPSDDGEPPLELLPNLEEVIYWGGRAARDAFTTFLNGRQVAGHPVSLQLVDPLIFEPLLESVLEY